MIPKIVVFVTFVLVSAMATASTDQFTVRWEGALRSVHGGDFSGKASLSQFSKKDGLYAVGPVAGLDGEITVIGGAFYISRVRDGEIKTDSDPSTEAAFLVWAEVDRWKPSMPLGEDVRNHAHLEQLIEELAIEAGIDIKEPFPFLIEGIVESVEYHVLAPLDQHREASGHKESAENIEVRNVDARIVGFFSKKHQGVFTHRGSSAHLHIVEDSGKSGHVDKLAVGANARIRLPY